MSDLALDAERVSYVVHELRSPLAVVSGYTSFLLDEGAGELGDEQREILDRVRRSAKMLERLLSDVAEFARTVVAPSSKDTLERVDLREPLAEAAELESLIGAGASLGDAGLVPDAPIEVLGDPIAVRQSLLAVAAWIARGSTRGRIEGSIEVGPEFVTVAGRSSGIEVPEDIGATLGDPLAPVPGLADAAAWRLGLAAAASRLARMGGGLELVREGTDLVARLRFRAAPRDA